MPAIYECVVCKVRFKAISPSERSVAAGPQAYFVRHCGRVAMFIQKVKE
jgi:hypothetical protein